MTVHWRGATVEATDLIESMAAERPTSEMWRANERRAEGARNVALPEDVPFIRRGVSSQVGPARSPSRTNEQWMH